MNILILGSGGREHALAWRTSLDQSSSKVFVWPGNDGIAGKKIELVKDSFSKDSFKNFISQNSINLVIPGAEKFLYEGVADWCQELNVNCFGPSAKASRLEQSKLFSKTLMVEAGVPTAPYQDLTEAFRSDLNRAYSTVNSFKRPVIKISGPSLGKGVFVCSDITEAKNVLGELHRNPIAGLEDGLLVEEAVSGQEVSMFFACDGSDYTYLGSAQDHKRLLDEDRGPNTGGMGAYSPVSWVNESFIKKVVSTVLNPTLEAMKQRGTPFRGVLFLGLMVNGESINLLEYNVRFGDPETQALLPLLEGDFTSFLSDMTKSSLVLKKASSVHIVKAARGYPGLFGAAVEKGRSVTVSELEIKTSKLFFAGVKKVDQHLVTDGGRVLGVTAWGETHEKARELAYEGLESAYFDGEQFRRDIGRNA